MCIYEEQLIALDEQVNGYSDAKEVEVFDIALSEWEGAI